MRIGVFGGTFDPPHRAHIGMATRAAEQLGLDRVEIIPCHTPPHREPPSASPFERFAMVVLATQNAPKLIPSPRELRRGGISYTAETLREIAREIAGAELYLIIGADSFDELPSWRDPLGITSVAHLAVMARPGSATIAPDDTPVEGRKTIVNIDGPPLDVSARQIRARLGDGAVGLQDLDPTVERYIRRLGLYGTQGTPA